MNLRGGAANGRFGAYAALVFGVLSFLLPGSGYAVAATTVPDTPAGKAFAGWIGAFNGGSTAAYDAFVKKNWPSGVKYAGEDRHLREVTGGYDLKRIEASSTPTRLVALVQEHDNDQFDQFTLAVDANDPRRITDVLILKVPRPAEFALPHLGMESLIGALRDRLQRQTARDLFSGAVLFAQDGKPVFARAYGLADRERKTPNTLQTRFRIGSMNKMFTAVATLQLVQAGKVKLDAPLATYLPDYPNKELAAKVTIQQLLTHTGGTGDIFGPKFEAHRLELRTVDDYVHLYGTRALKFEPGSQFGYSNYGFVLLGAVIEKVSGESYYDYVREHIYLPAQMTATGSDPENQAVARRSIGYTNARGVLRPNTGTLPFRGMPAGGGYSTVQDLVRFATALQHNTLLDARHTELLTRGKVAMHGTGRRYAFGFADQTINGTRCIGHNGGAPGMNGDLAICADGRYVIAVLANRDPGTAQQISDFITNRLPQQ